MIGKKLSSSSPPAIIHIPSNKFINEPRTDHQSPSLNAVLLKGQRQRYHRKKSNDSEIIITPLVGVTASIHNYSNRTITPETESEGSSAQSFFDQKKNTFINELKHVYRRFSLLNCLKRSKGHDFERSPGCLT